jgi:pimeloyl-ACP methyl ester carboxylesterase
MRLALGERLAARHRVILLDRPGLGWSERKGGDGSSPTYQAVMLSAVGSEWTASFWSAIPGAAYLR